MLESEVQSVLKALRRADVQIVAIHQHMTGETPRIMFLHYWGIGRARISPACARGSIKHTHNGAVPGSVGFVVSQDGIVRAMSPN